jgi:hypothetical protein
MLTINFLAPLRDTLEACGFYETVDVSNFYPTIHDAVNAALTQKQLTCIVTFNIKKFFRVELAAQPPPDPIPPSTNLLQPSSVPPPVIPIAKSARSLINNSFVSIQSVRHPMSESGSTRRLRSPTNWSLHISPLTREGRSGSEWLVLCCCFDVKFENFRVAPRLLDELDDV